jgi:hypothetical protein
MDAAAFFRLSKVLEGGTCAAGAAHGPGALGMGE